MITDTTLELRVRPAATGDGYIADTAVYRPGDADQLVAARDIPLGIDRNALMTLVLEASAYGRALAAMLFADGRLRQVWDQERHMAQSRDQVLRLLLDLDARDPILNSVRWELLTDPTSNEHIFLNPSIVASRYLTGADLAPIVLRPPADLRALAVIASPMGLERFRLEPLDTAREVQQLLEALRPMPLTILASGNSRPSLEALREALTTGVDVLYLKAHGAAREGEPYFFLESKSGEPEIVSVSDLAALIAGLPRQPLLVVLASCRSSGSSEGIESSAAAPWFAAAGIPAIVAMQGDMSMETTSRLMPAFFDELRRYGLVDRAMAIARSQVSDRPDWWNPVLLSRVRDGRIWSEVGAVAESPEVAQHPNLVEGAEKRTTPSENIVEPVSTPPASPVGQAAAISEAPADSASAQVAQVESAAAPAQPEAAQESLPELGARRGAVNDEVGPEDQLDVINYIRAFADLIEARDTAPPLTIGVYGSWGMGKSFILDGIAKELKGRADASRTNRRDAQTPSDSKVSQVHVIFFNAWQYNASEVVWPGLVREIMDRIERETTSELFGLIRLRFWRNLARQVRRERGRILVVSALVLVIAAFLFFALQFDIRLVVGALASLGVVGITKLISDTLTEPLSQWITKLFQEEEYGKQIGYMSRIRDDLVFLEQRLTKQDSRILVIIDDLDRCEPSKAVEVLQAIRLLLNFDSFIVCMGIDARIITAAVEKYYEELLGEAGASGYEYLDKIVQIPFQIPRPTPEIIRGFLAKQMQVAEPVSGAPGATVGPGTVLTGDVPRFGAGVASDDKTPDAAKSPTPVRDVPAFTRAELVAFQHIAGSLKPNPRYLKRMINVYRLVRTLAQYRGDAAVLRYPAVIIRWLVISAQWPCVAYAMLWHLENMLEDTDEQGRPRFPDEPTLPCLLRRACATIGRETRWRELQSQLDGDLDDLERLIDQGGSRMAWEDLRAIRRYTINFNPAVEAELRLTEPSESADRQAQPNRASAAAIAQAQE
jgi:Cdc6-like AAA superfamily ATPase